jgi:hypothetical protein
MHAIISLVDRNKALLNNKSFISYHTKNKPKNWLNGCERTCVESKIIELRVIFFLRQGSLSLLWY